MANDVMRQLGALAFASRLKRLGDRLQRDGSRIYREQRLDFQARWFPVSYVLSRRSPMAVTEIAEELGLTHAAVNQIAGQMARRGLLCSRKDRSDERRRLLSLTPKGRKTVVRLRPLWKAIQQCTVNVLEGSTYNVLEGLAEVEKALDHKEMYERIQEALHRKKRQ